MRTYLLSLVIEVLRVSLSPTFYACTAAAGAGLYREDLQGAARWLAVAIVLDVAAPWALRVLDHARKDMQ